MLRTSSCTAVQCSPQPAPARRCSAHCRASVLPVFLLPVLLLGSCPRVQLLQPRQASERWFRLRGGSPVPSMVARMAGMPGTAPEQGPSDSDEEWGSFCQFATSKGLPVPPKDRSLLPKINSEHVSGFFPGGDGSGLEDPRIRYLYSNVPSFGKMEPQPLQEISAGQLVWVVPRNVTRTAESTESVVPPYHAQVIDLPTFLSTEEPSDARALLYKYRPELQRFDHVPPSNETLACRVRDGTLKAGEEGGDLCRTYGQRQFVSRFYPEVESEAMDLFETDGSSSQWLLAVAMRPDGTPLLQRIPRPWVHVIPSDMLPLRREGSNADKGWEREEEVSEWPGVGAKQDEARVQTQDEQMRMFKAAREGNVTEVVRLLREVDDSPFWQDETSEGMQAMHLAAWHGHAQVCEALHQLRPHLSCHSARDRRSRTPLHLAAMGGWPDTAQLLIDFEAHTPSAANEAAPQPSAINGATAARTETAAVGYVNVRDADGKTALHYAAACILGREDAGAEACAVLVRSGAAINARDVLGSTPLHVAADMGCAPACAVLLKAGADVSALDVENRSAAELAWTAPVALQLGVAPVSATGVKEMWMNLSAAQQANVTRASIAGRVQQQARLANALADLELHVATLPDNHTDSSTAKTST